VASVGGEAVFQKPCREAAVAVAAAVTAAATINVTYILGIHSFCLTLPIYFYNFYFFI
jgi:hypothetical protein